MEPQSRTLSSSGRLLLVWLGLVALTGATVTATSMHLGDASVVASIGIALIKASLVVLVFMNLGREPRLFKVMLLVGLLTLATIMALTFVDIAFR
jgi:cytochrome c oxidase subunit 4